MLKCLCHKSNRAALLLALVFAWTGLSCCESQSQPSALSNSTAATPPVFVAPAPGNPQTLVLREGDTVHIVFSGAHSLDNLQTIRRDGKITLEMVGEIKAAGWTAP